MINRVVLVGRLTKDPELEYTPSGVAKATFTLAVNRTFSNQQGEREADFIRCTVWRKQAENSANFLKKGHLAGVEGRIQTGNYEGQDGKRVYTTDVIADSVQFLEPKSNNGQGTGNQQQSQQSFNGAAPNGGNAGNGQTYQQQQPTYQQQPSNNNQQQFNQQQQQQQQYANVGGGQQYGGGQQQQNYNQGYPDYNQGPMDVSDDDLPF